MTEIKSTSNVPVTFTEEEANTIASSFFYLDAHWVSQAVIDSVSDRVLSGAGDVSVVLSAEERKHIKAALSACVQAHEDFCNPGGSTEIYFSAIASKL